MSENNYHIKSLEKAVKMFKSLRGKEITSTEFREICREFKIRDGLLKYCVDRGLCDVSRHKFQNDGKHNLYKFADNLQVTPRLVKFVLDDQANYMRELASKKEHLEKAVKFKEKKKEETLKRASLKVKSRTEKIVVESKEREDKNNKFSVAEIIDKVREDERNKMYGWVNSLQGELKELDKTCLSYLEHIDTLEERIKELEKDKEEIRDLFFTLQLAKIKKEVEV